MAAVRLGALLAPLLLLQACGGGAETPPAPVAPGPLRIPVGEAPQRGPDDAWVTIVEFSDFQCPYCASAEPTVAALLAEYPADVRLLYRHYPLTTIHQAALPAAEAAECARLQGSAPDGLFWPMHDLLIADQPALAAQASSPGPLLSALAARVDGLVTADWDACLAGHGTRARISADVALAQGFLQGTPTFVVNGTEVLGTRELRSAVLAALGWARQQTDFTRSEYYDRAVLGL